MKKLSILALICFILLSFTSCGADNYYEPSEESMERYSDTGLETADNIGEKQTTAEEVLQSNVTNRKLIKNVYMDVETTDFDGFMSNLEKSINQFGGYTEKSEVSGRSYSYSGTRYATVTVRIPADDIDKFVSGISESCTVTSKTEEVTDVTLTYVDLESHIKALQTEEQTLLGLLEKAETLDDTLSIQKRLSEIRYELENYESSLRTLESLVSYSTVTIYIHEVEKPSTVVDEKQSVWQEISTRFSDSLYDVTHGLRSFFVWFAGSLPHIIIWAVIIAGVTLIVVAIVKKKKNKKPDDKE